MVAWLLGRLGKEATVWEKGEGWQEEERKGRREVGR